MLSRNDPKCVQYPYWQPQDTVSFILLPLMRVCQFLWSSHLSLIIVEQRTGNPHITRVKLGTVWQIISLLDTPFPYILFSCLIFFFPFCVFPSKNVFHTLTWVRTDVLFSSCTISAPMWQTQLLHSFLQLEYRPAFAFYYIDSLGMCFIFSLILRWKV